MDLFQKVFKKKISEEFWKWRYGVFGKPIAGLLWDEKKLVGHYMLSPIPMKIDEHIENALLAMSVMIDPDYQGKGSLIDDSLTSFMPSKIKEIITNQTPMKRLTKPVDVANTVLFLCSNLSDFITGENIIVSGGQTII